jgi:glycosyltransferase involved in cell wall biosynthesis
MSKARAVQRVVIDARMVRGTPHGFARYVTAIAAGLQRVSELSYEPVFLVSGHATRAGEEPASHFRGFHTVETGARFLSPVELIEIPILLRRLGASLYHSPTFSSLRNAPCPWIVTVHDLNHLKYGGWKEKVYYERLLKPFVKKARALATVSEFSRKELAEWSGWDAARIDVVHNAIDPAFMERVPAERIAETAARFGLRVGQYFFCLSNPKPHKNLGRLVAAFSRYRQRDIPLAPGRGGAAPAYWDLALNLRAGELEAGDHVHLLGPPSDEDARALMAGAGAVVFPSEYEGFGLPPVEAACLGAPLVVSRIAPHREALGDLVQGEVLWVDPSDTEAWAVALGRATGGAVLGASIESRSALMKHFSVAAIGTHMDRIYRRVLGSGSNAN